MSVGSNITGPTTGSGIQTESREDPVATLKNAFSDTYFNTIVAYIAFDVDLADTPGLVSKTTTSAKRNKKSDDNAEESTAESQKEAKVVVSSNQTEACQRFVMELTG